MPLVFCAYSACSKCRIRGQNQGKADTLTLSVAKLVQAVLRRMAKKHNNTKHANHNKYKSYNRYFLLITQEGQNGQVIIWYNNLSLSPDIKYIASNVLIFPFVWSEPKTFLLWQEQ